MTFQEILKAARDCSGPCRACPECNGKACGNTIPGPGSKGIGDVAIRNYDAWKKIRVNMNTISENVDPDTTFDFFGKQLAAPIFAGPVGAMKMHYGDKYTDLEYNNILVKACADAGILAFTGDGMDAEVMKAACLAIADAGGQGIPTVKPWDLATLKEKFALVEGSGCSVVATDIDAAGLPFLRNMQPPAGSKTVSELRDMIEAAGKPYIIKGIMTVKGALAAKEAGASGIVVSNHRGGVLDQCPSTAEVLEEIADAVGDSMMVLVDGGIRSGDDIFKAIALGADAVLIARRFVTAVYGGGAEGVRVYTQKLIMELKDTMKMCGAATLKDIDRGCLFRPSSKYFSF